MKSGSVLLCLWIGAVLAGGCRQREQQASVIVSEPAPVVHSDTLTLSGDQLISLDWAGRSPSGPKVVRKHAVDNSGAVFDIQFSGNNLWQNSIDYVSSGSGGRMALVGLDVGGYQTFALKFTLVSIDGAVGPTLPQELAVGAVVGPTADGKLSQYEPLVLGFAGQQISGVARTPIGAPRLREIGIHVHMANPETWNPEGALVTLLVEPVPEATVPSPPPVVEEKKPRQKPSGLPDFGPARTGAW
ncbi:MAG: hypothetical protein JW955_01035 [Sedimentisphaerales bacterium]|nr:hypothetical protein [Sedimentisphaerales bacterium]